MMVKILMVIALCALACRAGYVEKIVDIEEGLKGNTDSLASQFLTNKDNENWTLESTIDLTIEQETYFRIWKEPSSLLLRDVLRALTVSSKELSEIVDENKVTKILELLKINKTLFKHNLFEAIKEKSGATPSYPNSFPHILQNLPGPSYGDKSNSVLISYFKSWILLCFKMFPPAKLDKLEESSCNLEAKLFEDAKINGKVKAEIEKYRKDFSKAFEDLINIKGNEDINKLFDIDGKQKHISTDDIANVIKFHIGKKEENIKSQVVYISNLTNLDLIFGVWFQVKVISDIAVTNIDVKVKTDKNVNIKAFLIELISLYNDFKEPSIGIKSPDPNINLCFPKDQLDQRKVFLDHAQSFLKKINEMDKSLLIEKSESSWVHKILMMYFKEYTFYNEPILETFLEKFYENEKKVTPELFKSLKDGANFSIASIFYYITLTIHLKNLKLEDELILIDSLDKLKDLCKDHKLWFSKALGLLYEEPYNIQFLTSSEISTKYWFKDSLHMLRILSPVYRQLGKYLEDRFEIKSYPNDSVENDLAKVFENFDKFTRKLFTDVVPKPQTPNKDGPPKSLILGTDVVNIEGTKYKQGLELIIVRLFVLFLKNVPAFFTGEPDSKFYSEKYTFKMPSTIKSDDGQTIMTERAANDHIKITYNGLPAFNALIVLSEKDYLYKTYLDDYKIKGEQRDFEKALDKDFASRITLGTDDDINFTLEIKVWGNFIRLV